jgi:hypothetical protein
VTRAALLAALALVLAVPVARADGDPASDVLVGDRVFFPYEVKIPREHADALKETIIDARDQGVGVRVALIAHDFDLGSAALLYRRPQQYAKFLAEELGNFNRDWLLVVMPNGYGIYKCKPRPREGYSDPCEGTFHTAADERALAAVPPPRRSEDFAASAEAAVKALAERHGASFGPGLWPWLGGAAVVVLGAGVLLGKRSRRREDPALVGGVDGDDEPARTQQPDRALHQD